MTNLLHNNAAFGRPGIEPRWTRSDKDGVGTAYSASSPIWFTVSAGILNEVYYPTIDKPQTRDLQFLVSDGESFFHDERRNTRTTTKRLCEASLGYHIVNEDEEGRYRIEKEIICAPHAACILMHTRFVPVKLWRGKLKLYVLLAPHLGVGGWGNNGNVVQLADREVLVAHKDKLCLAMGCTHPFIATSCGYVGCSDGWQDLQQNYRLDWNFEAAEDGNIAMVAQVDTSSNEAFTLGLALSDHQHGAITTLMQSLAIPFSEQVNKFQIQWERASTSLLKLGEVSCDKGKLYHISQSLLLSHEDKTYQGAMIASMSIPWGEAKSDEDIGGYHLVWTRDMVNSATGLLATGNTATPFRALVYLASSQLPDGGFHQNFWVDGDPYWTGIQLDEVAFPILLAWKLHKANALHEFDPYPMVKRAAGYLIRQGPATPQERWEENSGYSPSTLASNIAALTCAAMFAKERGDDALSEYLHQYADFLECHIEQWTVTTEGTLVEDIPRHFIRIHPVDVGNPHPDENPNQGTIEIKNRAPGQQREFPAVQIVDAGFLELVRYGIRIAGDPLIEDSLRVVDSVLKVDSPGGPCWRRYNNDGYGQRADGGPFVGWGQGRAWPLLTGERAHYELAAGRDVTPYIRAIEYFANSTGLLPEQVWDEEDRPQIRMFNGRPTGSAMPLMWAHAEYIKLLRSVIDGQVFDLIPEVAARYRNRSRCCKLEIWKPNRQISTIARDHKLRLQAPEPFRLRVSFDSWQSHKDRDSMNTTIGVHYCDIEARELGEGPMDFTFFWPNEVRWENHNYQIEIREHAENLVFSSAPTTN